MLDSFMPVRTDAAAVLVAAVARRNRARAVRPAPAACLGGVVATPAVLAVTRAAGPVSGSLGTGWPEACVVGAGGGVRVDVLSTGMLALVSLLGRGVVRYSQRYPGGDARPARYLRKPLQIDPRPSVEYQRRAGASAEAGNNAWVNRFEVSPHV